MGDLRKPQRCHRSSKTAVVCTLLPVDWQGLVLRALVTQQVLGPSNSGLALILLERNKQSDDEAPGFED
jgi:hypothetical protein